MISQDRQIEVRDVRVRHEDQAIVAGGQPRPRFDCAELQDIEALAGQSNDLEPYTRIVSSGPPQDVINKCFIAEHEGAVTSVWIKVYTD